MAHTKRAILAGLALVAFIAGPGSISALGQPGLKTVTIARAAEAPSLIAMLSGSRITPSGTGLTVTVNGTTRWLVLPFDVSSE